LQQSSYDNYKKEFNKWSDCPCNGKTILNDGWEIVPGVYTAATTYDNTHTYETGDTCSIAYLTFRATRQLTGVRPTQSVGHKESIYRVAKWIDNRIALLDAYLNYNQN
jgi:hypothetical protein